MKIAFISYEYPPDTADGGIATYIYQAAKMLASRGHYVEVFAASRQRTETSTESGVVVHRLLADIQHEFHPRIGQLFANRHAEIGFDVLEGPEYGADAREAVRLVPDMPLVVKLHTPTFMIQRMNFSRLSLATKARFYFGAVRRRIPPPWHPENGGERLHILDADEIAAPSRSIGQEVAKMWHLGSSQVAHVPYPYVPSKGLLDIAVETNTNVVTFFGRLEVRKGVLDLARAIPLVLHSHPQVKFRFIGRPMSSPRSNLDMRQYLERRLAPYRQSVDFLDAVPLDAIPTVLAETDLCVFPSLWENFPNVCLEAMAAARGVIGSSAGGMAEMLENGGVGRVVPPKSPVKIAEAINELVADPPLRMRLGQAARSRILEEYNTERILTLQEASYYRAIKVRQQSGSRSVCS